MSDLTLQSPTLARGPTWRGLAGELVLGAVYWGAFVLALEPGNVMRAADIGHPLALEPEAERIVAASLLGAVSAPIVLAFVRRFPIEAGRVRRHAAVLAAAVVGLTIGLIAISCGLVALFGRFGNPDVASELADNGLLVAFCLAGFMALGHAVHFRSRPGQARPVPPSAAAPERLAQLAVKTRSGLLMLALEDVDWIETQGNYLALYAGGAAHLIRETSARLEARLDPERFVRVHRRTLVALDRVRALRPLGGGDAELSLADGTRLRVSRSFRARLQSRLEGARQSE